MARSRSSSSSSSSDSNSHSARDTRDKVKDKAAHVLGIGRGLARSFVESSRRPHHETDEQHNGGGASTSHHSFHVNRPWSNGLTADLPRDMAKSRAVIWTTLVVIFLAALIFALGWPHLVALAFPWIGILPNDPWIAALTILDKAPVIDGHIDLPWLARYLYANNATAIDLQSTLAGHVDIPRLQEGKVGGFFWSVYVPCADDIGAVEGSNFTDATWLVRDTLEQIDISKELIAKYPKTFAPANSAEDILNAVKQKKIASIIGVEGGHQFGNSLAVVRQYYALGVRYSTLTHTCHNAFADSCGFVADTMKEPLHNGLSPLGYTLIQEMNRLGMLVDLSHTSDQTAKQALEYSQAPVIWSHSSARALHNHVRNIPDEILSLVGAGQGKKDAVIMVNFAPGFVANPGEADVKIVADHVEHIAKLAGKQSVGIGSDYDGIPTTPKDLEDVSKYPNLIAELYSRGWNKYELAGLTGANLIRVFKGAEKVAKDLQAKGTLAAYDIYDKRPDLPIPPREL